MNIETFREFCLRKKAVSESFPFDASTLVFKVAGKMFALTDVDTFDFINLKCDPERAVELRDQYEGVTPGYHMNKKLWNSVYLRSDVPDHLIEELIDHSYELIVASLTKKAKQEYALG
jgi:predicted DNA-binding protein (MmcQ/YjbR family)